MPIQTKPTGLSGVPPPGPAIPVVEHETVLEHRDRTPAAIAKATGSLTAPCSNKTSCGTDNNSCLMVLEYATTPPEYHVLEPGRSTNAAAHSPPYKILRLRSSSLGSTEHHVVSRRLNSWQITIDHLPTPDGGQNVRDSALRQCLPRILIQGHKRGWPSNAKGRIWKPDHTSSG